MTERDLTHEDLSQRADLLAIADLIEPRERVLDLGCGDGVLLSYLKDRYEITGRGIELREAQVLACVRRGISVRQGNLHEGLGDYPDGSFDTVILSQTIPYLNDPAFIIWEMLRVGQRAIISLPNWGYWRCRLSLLFTGRMPVVPALPQVWDEAPRARPLTIQDFEQFCNQHKFHISRQINLNGSRRLRGRFDRNLRATVAVFELRGGKNKASYQ
jgi:methionine biosynthesis protein MetW